MELPQPLRPIKEEFNIELMMKDIQLVALFIHLRNVIIRSAPACYELIYHTHALTTVFSHTTKLKHAFCHIPIYTHHLNLGFNKGFLLSDPEKKLQGTGKQIRHLPIKSRVELENDYLLRMVEESILLSQPK